ncbi:MAG: energy transducer TonB [Acidobacteriota bacterium]
MPPCCRFDSLPSLAAILVLWSLGGLSAGVPAAASEVEVFAVDEVYTGDVEAFLDFALSSDDFEQVLAESEFLSQSERDLVCLVASRESMPLDELNERFVAIGWPGPYFGKKPVDEGQKISGPMPQYTEEARAQRIQGTVSVHMVLDEAGRPRSLGLEGDPQLRIASARTLAGWRFEPARLDGDPVAVCRFVTTNFRLQ